MVPVATRDRPTPQRLRSLFRLLGTAFISCALILCLCGDSIAKSIFFASLKACAASYMFKKQECANAFTNADAERRRSLGGVTSQIDCVRRFHLCEPQREVASDLRGGSYVPAMLGVEMSNTNHGWIAIPVFAVELPPGVVRPHPISHIATFTAAPSFAPTGTGGSRAPNVPPDANDGRVESLMPSPRAREDIERARAERRERLRNAPFVE